VRVLVVNCGSSSIKYQFLDMDTEQVLCKGLAERIGIPGSRIVHKKDEQKVVIEKPMKDHEDALKYVLELIVDEKVGGVKDLSEIDAVVTELSMVEKSSQAQF